MHCTAVVLGAAVDVRRRRNGPAAHRGAAKRRIQVGVLVHDRDELWRLAALSFGFCDRFLVETDFGTGCEEHKLDAGCHHGGNDGLAVVSDRDLDPCAGLVAAAVTGAHGFIPCSFLVRCSCPGATRIARPLAERHPGSSPWQALAGTNARAHRDRVESDCALNCEFAHCRQGTSSTSSIQSAKQMPSSDRLGRHNGATWPLDADCAWWLS